MFAKRRISLSKQIGGIFLLAAYLFVFLFSNISHKVAHDHKESQELHTLEAEQDDCHRTIYHAEQNNGCDHREHFLPYEASCDLCDAFVRNLQWTSFQDDVTLFSGQILINDCMPLSPHAATIVSTSPPRAPPFFV